MTKRLTIFWYRIKKKLSWEFAPTWVVYLPFLWYGFYWCIRTRSFTFFTAANPGIENGGLFGESKYEILKKLPPSVVPKSILIENPAQWTPHDFKNMVLSNGIEWPFILKPDKGERGRGVSKIKNEKDLEEYLNQYSFPLIVQPFVSEKEEYGILYHRFPHQSKGQITSIVVKGFLSVTGDGVSNMESLWLKNPRCLYHWDLLQGIYGSEKHLVLPRGEIKELVSIGNHARGTTFLNGNYLISETLTNTIDQIAQGIPGFYIGRFDLKAANIEAVCRGEFQVMELNGVGAEPGHIYAPGHPVLKSYSALIRHWHNVAEIARLNYLSGTPKYSFKAVNQKFKAYLEYQKTFLNV
ncbi:MAG: D-alanine--D-alanine ligase [Bacteroidia bacterium]|nr:D-alanine--D-alanine ligase [Bacteroidia bacterium]